MQYDFLTKNRALCHRELDLIPQGGVALGTCEELAETVFLRVHGLSHFWSGEDGPERLSAALLSGFAYHRLPFSCLLVGDEKGVSFYLGTLRPMVGALCAALEGVYPGTDLEQVSGDPLAGMGAMTGGLFTGIPEDKLAAKPREAQIEQVCRSMLGRRFVYLVKAVGIHPSLSMLAHEQLLREMSDTYSQLNKTVSGGALGNISAQQQDFTGKSYYENLERLEQRLQAGISKGMWRYCGFYGAEDPADARRLAGIIRASYAGENSRPEAFRTIECRDIDTVLRSRSIPAEESGDAAAHPLGTWFDVGSGRQIDLCHRRYQTLVNSDQLGVLFRLPTREFPGYYIDEYAEFDVSERRRDSLREPLEIGDVCAAGRRGYQVKENRYSIERDDLTRHALIVGVTGGGKSNTTKSLLKTLWADAPQEQRIPFLVIESAKREYWELCGIKGFEDLTVFTLGDEGSETAVPYRLNPFETPPGISLQTHIDYLLATFKAAFDLPPPTPYVLERAVYAVYQDRGWDIVENYNRYGLTEYPTLSDLHRKVGIIVEDLGYHQEIQSNVKAALEARVYSLMIGGKGAMLDTAHSIPIGQLLSRPVVLELEDLGDDEVKSFVTGLMLVQLYEYRKTQMTVGSKALSHILMVEEAHRLLKNVPEGGEGSRARSVEFFCNLLAEIRTYGQGIFIADQIPTKLAPDTMKNTNLKIVHRTVAHEDREAIGRAMNMNDSQIAYLSSLRRGYAAVYAEGDNHPKCVKLPLVKANCAIERAEVLRASRTRTAAMVETGHLTRYHAGCDFCEGECRGYGERIAYLEQRIHTDQVAAHWAAQHYEPQALAKFLDSDTMGGLHMRTDKQRLCMLGILLQYCQELSDGRRQAILAAYLKNIYEKGGKNHG